MIDERALPYTDVTALQNTDLAAVVEETRSYMQTVNELKPLIETGKARILELLQAAKMKTVFVGDARVTVAEGRKPSKTLSVEKLQKLNVPLSTIDACYVYGKPGSPSVRILIPGAAEEV